MSDKMNVQQAIAEIKGMRRVFQAFETSDNALAALANLDTVSKELKKAVDDTRAELDKVRADVDAAKLDLAKARKAKGDAEAGAAERATAMVAEAESKAAGMIADAQASAQSCNEAATTAATARDAAAGELARIEARIAELRPLLDRAERIAAAAG